ncbi:MAG: hypothetical protein AAGB32_05530 [Pseudomonadota bacterium]
MRVKMLWLGLICFVITMMAFKPANALQYRTCLNPEKEAACLIAFRKIQTLINPITKERFYHDDAHISNGKLLMPPVFYIATPDLDGDQSPEIIVQIVEYKNEFQGYYCIGNNQCPHFIIQDRTLPEQNRTIKTMKAIGPIYSSGVAISTDERVDNFLSLRAYRDPFWKSFDVYQYDRQSDSYFNMTAGP